MLKDKFTIKLLPRWREPFFHWRKTTDIQFIEEQKEFHYRYSTSIFWENRHWLRCLHDQVSKFSNGNRNWVYENWLCGAFKTFVELSTAKDTIYRVALYVSCADAWTNSIAQLIINRESRCEVLQLLSSRQVVVNITDSSYFIYCRKIYFT